MKIVSFTRPLQNVSEEIGVDFSVIVLEVLRLIYFLFFLLVIFSLVIEVVNHRDPQRSQDYKGPKEIVLRRVCFPVGRPKTQKRSVALKKEQERPMVSKGRERKLLVVCPLS